MFSNSFPNSTWSCAQFTIIRFWSAICQQTNHHFSVQNNISLIQWWFPGSEHVNRILQLPLLPPSPVGFLSCIQHHSHFLHVTKTILCCFKKKRKKRGNENYMQHTCNFHFSSIFHRHYFNHTFWYVGKIGIPQSNTDWPEIYTHFTKQNLKDHLLLRFIKEPEKDRGLKGNANVRHREKNRREAEVAGKRLLAGNSEKCTESRHGLKIAINHIQQKRRQLDYSEGWNMHSLLPN